MFGVRYIDQLRGKLSQTKGDHYFPALGFEVGGTKSRIVAYVKIGGQWEREWKVAILKLGLSVTPIQSLATDVLVAYEVAGTPSSLERLVTWTKSIEGEKRPLMVDAHPVFDVRVPWQGTGAGEKAKPRVAKITSQDGLGDLAGTIDPRVDSHEKRKGTRVDNAGTIISLNAEVQALQDVGAPTRAVNKAKRALVESLDNTDMNNVVSKKPYQFAKDYITCDRDHRSLQAARDAAT